MSNKKDGGNAFPNVDGDLGMSLRDWFAGQIIGGIFSDSRMVNYMGNKNHDVAEIAYRIADVMLKERGKE